MRIKLKVVAIHKSIYYMNFSSNPLEFATFLCRCWRLTSSYKLSGMQNDMTHIQSRKKKLWCTERPQSKRFNPEENQTCVTLIYTFNRWDDLLNILSLCQLSVISICWSDWYNYTVIECALKSAMDLFYYFAIHWDLNKYCSMFVYFFIYSSSDEYPWQIRLIFSIESVGYMLRVITLFCC